MLESILNCQRVKQVLINPNMLGVFGVAKIQITVLYFSIGTVSRDKMLLLKANWVDSMSENVVYDLFLQILNCFSALTIWIRVIK